MTRLRPTVLLTLTALALTPSALPSTSVIGGSTVQVQSAPWTVFLRQTTSSGALQCSGSIIDSLHVVTAAHCVYDLNGAQASISSLSIRAGISSYSAPLAGDVEQDRTVS